jgi:hypothetical protein
VTARLLNRNGGQANGVRMAVGHGKLCRETQGREIVARLVYREVDDAMMLFERPAPTTATARASDRAPSWRDD